MEYIRINIQMFLLVKKIFRVKQDFFLHPTGSEKSPRSRREEQKKSETTQGKESHYYFHNIRNNAMFNCHLPLAFSYEPTPLNCYVLIKKIKNFGTIYSTNARQRLKFYCIKFIKQILSECEFIVNFNLF